MKHFVRVLGCLLLWSGDIQALKIYLLSHHDNAGDHNQVLGIKSAFIKLSPEISFEDSFEDINTKTTNPKTISEDVQKDLLTQKVVVIGSGEGGIDGAINLPKNPHLITCLTSHMFLDRYQNLPNIDYIALPIHVSGDIKAKLGSKLIETVGVAHNRQPKVCEDVYNKWKKEIPEAPTYMAVILGGDAPLPPPSKGIKHFTEQDAQDLAKYVTQHAHGATVLVLNGPRTGKYNAKGEEDKDVHRKNYSDPITELFVQKLKQNHIKYKLFDFQHNSPENKPYVSPFNSFDLIVGLLQQKEGKLLVPGESTSMISEAIDTLPQGKVLVYTNGAMNPVHESHVNSELNAERIDVLENYREIKASSKKVSEPPSSAAQVIAKRLWEAATPY